MAENNSTTPKAEAPQQKPAKEERFEFRLTVNNYIICQRFFRIHGFKREAYYSYELVDALSECVDLINQDLNAKTRIFLEDTAPMVFTTHGEMDEWFARHKDSIKDTIYLLVDEEEKVYTVVDGKIVEYEKPFNHHDYIVSKNKENVTNFKLAFLDNGREVVSRTWDGSCYPRFIRTNVDLSNSRNKYRQTRTYAPIESFIVDEFIKERTDLIPKIVNLLCNACCYKYVEDYTLSDVYGDKVYENDIIAVNKRLYKQLDAVYRKKTANYFKNLF